MQFCAWSHLKRATGEVAADQLASSSLLSRQRADLDATFQGNQKRESALNTCFWTSEGMHPLPPSLNFDLVLSAGVTILPRTGAACPADTCTVVATWEATCCSTTAKRAIR